MTKLLVELWNLGTENLPGWAIKCLENDYDSKSLRILASMSKYDSVSEIDTYFQRSLKELGWENIEKQDYLMRYAKILAQDIVEDKTDPFSAAREIYQILVELDYPPELHGWFEIDEMIWEYEYFLQTGHRGYHFLPKDELIRIIKQISAELIQTNEA